MLHRALLWASCALVSAASFASAQQSVFRRWDQSAEFTSRGELEGSAGQISQAFAHGFSAGLETLTGAEYVVQDFELATREPWDAAVCGLDGKCLPDYANRRAYASNLLLPAGSGVGGFLIRHTFLATSPFKIAKTCSQWHHVWNFRQSANWDTDGISVLLSEAAPFRGTLLCDDGDHREIPRTEGGTQIVEELGWTGSATGPLPFNVSWWLDLKFDEIVLTGLSENTTYNEGPCTNPNEGYAGLDPDFDNTGNHTPARWDNYRWSVRAGTRFANGFAVIFWSTKVLPNGGIPTPFGQGYLDINDRLYIAAGAQWLPRLDADGIAHLDCKLGPAPSPVRDKAASFASWHAQALVVNDPAKQIIFRLSSLFSFRPNLKPAGFTAGTATSSGRVVAAVNRKNVCVRNDGRGVLTVQPQNNGTPVGPAVNICEWTCVRVAIPSGANEVKLSGPCSNPTRFVYAFDR